MLKREGDRNVVVSKKELYLSSGKNADFHAVKFPITAQGDYTLVISGNLYKGSNSITKNNLTSTRYCPDFTFTNINRMPKNASTTKKRKSIAPEDIKNQPRTGRSRGKGEDE